MSKMGGTAGVGKEAEAEVARGELGGRLAGLSIPRQVGVLALWPFLEQLLGFMVGFVDLLISTRLPEVCGGKLVVLDAMAVGGYVGWFLMILQYGMATGVSALVSRATGKRDGEMLRAAVGQGLVAGLLAGVVAMGVGLGMIPVLMSWFELSGVVRELAETYIRIMAWLCIPSGVMVCLSAALRGFGDTRTPFVAMVVVNVVNVFASWVLGFGGLGAFGFNGGEPMGVAGLAWGTVIGWAVGLVLLVGLVWWKGRGVAGDELGVRLEVEKMRPEGVMLRRIFKVALPQCAEVMGMWSIHSVVVKMVSGLAVAGAAGAMGAHILVIRMESLSFLPGFAIGAAGATLVGQYLGAGAPEKAMRAVRVCWFVGLAFMGALGVLFVALPEVLLGMMSPGGGVEVQQAIPLMLVCGLMQPFFATNIVMKSAMRGAGATKVVMRNSFTVMIVFRVILLPLCVKVFGFGLVGIWWLMLVDTIVQAVVFTVLFYGKKWLDTEV